MRQEELIKNIRNEFTGENLKLDSATKLVIQRGNETLNRALEELSINLYKREFHFIMELIQNAEDNEYEKGVDPFLRFILSEDRLIIQNNEIGFNEDNVRALCDIRKSTKKKVDGYVGEKGIGFKSVFKVSNSPEIHSNGFHFRFHTNKSKKKDLLGFILPDLIEDIDNGIDLDLTNIVLPFPKKNYGKFSKQLNDIKPDLLLFLKKLTNIQIINEVERTKIVFKKKIKSNGFVELVQENGDNWSNIHEESTYFKLFSEIVKVPKKYAKAERANVEQTEIIIGFRLERKNSKYIVDSATNCSVYNFLPISDYNFKFLIQADFILTSNRESIDESKSWNEWVRDKLTGSIKNSFIYLQETSLWTEYLDYFPNENEISEFFFTPIYNELQDWLFENRTVPVSDGENRKWIEPENICFYNREIIELYGLDFIRKKTKYSFLHPKSNFRSEINSLLGIRFWNWDYERMCLSDRTWLSSLTKNERDNFYDYLAKEYKNNDNVIEDLKNITIFFLHGSIKPESFNSSDDSIFWPLTSNKTYRFLNSVRFLDHDYRKGNSSRRKRILGLFRKIGIVEPRIRTIVDDYILPNYDYGNNNNTASTDLSKHHIEFLHFIYANYKTIKRDGRFFKKITDKIWIQSLSKKFFKPNQLFLSKDFDPNVKWEKLFSKQDVSYLHQDYAKNGFSKSEKHKFISFLYELGIKQNATANDIVNVFQSGNFSRIKVLLYYLNRSWNDYLRIINIEEVINKVRIPIKSELVLPSSLFINSRSNKYILGTTVSYLPNFISNKQLIKDLKVNINNIPNKYLIGALRSIKANEESSLNKKYVVSVYSRFKIVAEEVFSEERLLFSFREKKWLYPWQVVWNVNIDHFSDVFSEFGSQYTQELLPFFLNTAGINVNIETENIIQFLSIISTKERVNIQDKLRIEKAIGFLANKIKNRKLGIEEIKDIINKKSIYPDEKNYLKSSDEIFFADDDHLYKIFENKDASIFNLSKDNIGFKNDIINVAKDFNLKLMTEFYSTDYTPKKNLHSNKEWSEEIKNLISLVGYILNYRSQEIYNEFHSVFEEIENIKLFFVEHLSINYSIGNINESIEEPYFILNNGIYVSKHQLIGVQSLLSDIVIRLLGNKTIIADIVFIVSNSDEKNLLNYFDRFNIPYPNSDLRQFAKEKKKKLKEEEIVDIEDSDDEGDGTDDTTTELERHNNRKTETKRNSNVVIPVNIRKWESEIEPDFEVDILEHEQNEEKRDHTNNQGLSNRSGSIGGFFPRYEFSSDKTYEKEIGDWGEKFAFSNFSKKLIKQHKGKKYSIDNNEQKLQIFDSKGKMIVLFENRNTRGLTQSGYDFLLSTKENDFYIEVKSTTRSGLSKFNLEENQWDCCREEKDKFILVIVRRAGNRNATIERIPNLYKMYEDGYIYIKPGRMTLFI